MERQGRRDCANDGSGKHRYKPPCFSRKLPVEEEEKKSVDLPSLLGSLSWLVNLNQNVQYVDYAYTFFRDKVRKIYKKYIVRPQKKTL